MRIRITAVMLLAALLGSSWLLWSERDRSDSLLEVPEPSLRSGLLTEVSTSRSLNGTLSIETGGRLEVLAPGWQGLVGEVFAEVGSPMRNGLDVASVNGIVRRLVTTDVPFHRSISAGAEGRDVAQLQNYLVDAGYLEHLPSDPLTYHRRTSSALRRLSKEIGIQPPVSDFDPAWFIWAPPGFEITVDELNLHVGVAAPAPGEVIASSAPTVHSHAFNSGGVPAQLDGEWRIEFAEPSLQDLRLITTNGQLDDEALLLVLREYRNADGDVDNTSESLVELTVAATEVRESQLLRAPAGAVRPSLDGSKLCLFVRDEEAARGWRPIFIEVAEAPGSAVYVSSEEYELSSQTVLFNPTQILDGSLCP